MLKVAVVGVGGISGAHISAWETMEDAELVALCDIRPEQMKDHSDKRCYTNFDEMLEKEELDILDICLPTYLHAEFSIKAMNRGINVLCEKPISLNREDVKSVYDCAKANNVKFMVAQVLRFWPEYEYVKELYDTQKYGKLISGSMYRLGCYPAWSWDGWMMDEKRSGMVPFDLHIHDLDYMVYAFGKPNKTNTFRARRDNQDFINVVYEFDGFFINSQASWYACPYPFKSQFLFQFEKAIVAFEGGKLVTHTIEGESIEFASNEGLETGNDNVPKSDAYANEIRYFADCVLADKAAEKVQPEQLETVIDILKSL